MQSALAIANFTQYADDETMRAIVDCKGHTCVSTLICAAEQDQSTVFIRSGKALWVTIEQPVSFLKRSVEENSHSNNTKSDLQVRCESTLHNVQWIQPPPENYPNVHRSNEILLFSTM